MNLIYLDNNATTQPAPAVVDAILPFMREHFGNPSSVHRVGQRARQAIDQARGQVAQLINSAEAEITFTGGGTESVNTAIRGLLHWRAPRKRIITSTVEHAATRELCDLLAREGCDVVKIAVDQQGNLDLPSLAEALDEQTALVSIMWANNETGVITPLPEIAALCQQHKIPLHSDATQAVGKIPVDVKQTPVSAMSFAAHKFHGPKGVAGLYIRKGVRVPPLLIGGPQERNRRGGTENVPGIVGMGQAATLAKEFLPRMSEVATRRDLLEQMILQRIPDTFVNGNVTSRLPNTSNISFARLEAEAILLSLSESGICASAGAACSSGSLEPSHVLKAMHADAKIAHGAIRFSLSRYTTDEEIAAAVPVLEKIIARLRNLLGVVM